jgi:hypothetical protein
LIIGEYSLESRMSSPWKKKQQPEAVAGAVLKRAEVGKV